MSGRTLLAGLAWVLCLGAVVAAPYPLEGRATAWVQPNGTRLSLRVLGDEFYARTVTADGHTVIFNAADKTYYYAAPGPDGHSLVSSGIAADHAPPRWLPTHLSEPAASVAALRKKNIEKIAPHRAADWAAQVEAVRGRRDRERTPTPTPSPTSPTVLTPAGGPTVDTKVGLVILVQFPDDPGTPAVDPVIFPTTQAKMIRMCNEIGYTDDGNIGSIRDYYTDQSNGLLVLTQLVTPILTLQHPRNYYSYTNYPTNTILRDNGAAGNLMATDAVTLLKASSFDFSTLSKDSFNDVIATSLLFAGADSGVPTKGLWPFSGSVPTGIPVGAAGAPPYILNYQMTDVANAAMGIGTTCHELGHMLKKYPDLYDTTYSSAGIGYHSLMSIGNLLNSEKAPAPIDIYLKYFSGWATINDLTPTTLLNTTLPTTGNIGYRIRKPGSTTEYFMIENRGTGDRWSAFCPDKGIMIWHVDEAVTTQNQCPQMTLSQHYQCSLVQADGRCDLEHNANPGDITDLFKTTKGIFNNNTTPNANWWDGSASGISIVVSSAPAASMNVSFGSAPPTLSLSPTSQSVLAAGGSVSFQVTSNTTWSWSKDAAWITTSVPSTQTGDLTFTLTVAANTTIIPRTAVFTLNVPGGLTTTHTITQGGLLLPDFVVTPGSPSECGPVIVKPGGTVYVNSYISNQGTYASGPYAVNFYLSTDTTITTSDYLIGQKSQTSLAVDSPELIPMSDLTVPLTTPGGTYYAGWIYDPTNAVTELNKSNNTGYVSASTIIVDATLPTVAITSPATDGTSVVNPTLTVSGTAADNNSVAQVYIALNGGTSVLVTGTTSWSGSVSLVPGLNTVAAIAADTAGNWSGWIYRTVTYSPPDISKPTVAITSPASDATYVNSASLAVGGTATQGTYPINSIYCRIIGKTSWTLATGKTVWSINVPLNAGSNTISAFCYDDNGVASVTVSRTVIYDATPPTVAITTPASDGGTVNVPTLAIAGTAADNLNLTAVYLRSNGGAWTLASGTSAWSGTALLATGVNTIDVRSQDAATNFSTIVSRTVTYTLPDTTLPTVAITSPAADGTSVSSASLALSGSAADNIGVTAVSWQLNGGSWSTATGTTAWSASVTLAAGANTINVQSKDAANNVSAIASRTITLDASLPTVAITSPAADGTSVSSASLPLSGTAADNVGVTTVSWQINGGGWSTATGTTTWSASVPLAVGANTINVQSRDAANNVSAIASRTITLDSTLPTVAITSPAADGTSVSSPSLALSGSAADNIGVTAVSWQLNGGSWSTATGTTTWSASVPLAAGANTINVQAKDAANNVSAIASRTITLDSSLPTVGISSPVADGTSVSSSSLALSGSAADNIGVTTVSWRLNGGSWSTATGTTAWSASVTLAAGANTINVQAKDAANNVSAIASRTITLDSSLPTVAITSPAADGTSVSSSSLALSGTAADNLGVTAVSWQLNGGSWSTATGTTTWSASVTLAAGANTINVQSRDAASNFSAIVSRSVNYIPSSMSLPTWRLVNFGSTSNSGTGADLTDPDKDGISNLLEFAFNLNPNQASAKYLVAGTGSLTGLPAVTLAPNGHLRLEFIRRKAAGNPGIEYKAKFSSNLSVWTDPTSAATVTFIDDTWERVIVEDQPPTGAKTRFARVEVTNIIDSNAPSPLEAWRLANFGSTANSGDGADLNDFDKDGIPNLLEFALGLNPKQNSAALLPQPHLSGANLVLSFTQPAGVSGITYGAEWSQTLLPGSWTAMTDAGSQLQHLFSVPISGKTTLFMRFKVTNP